MQVADKPHSYFYLHPLEAWFNLNIVLTKPFFGVLATLEQEEEDP